MKKKQIWHNTKAMKDPRMVKLKKKYGFYGIGLYWIIIELLHKSASKKLLVNNDSRLNKEWPDLNPLRKLDFLMDCVNEFELFEHDGVHFWSDLKDKDIFVYQEEYPSN